LTQWAANMCKLWIQENCDALSDWDEDNEERIYYEVFDSDLDEMRFNFKTVSQKALDIGSEVHTLIEKYLKTGSLPVENRKMWQPEVGMAFKAFLDWAEEYKLKPISLEQTVYGDVDGYCWAGTMDIECYLNDKRTVIDFKTSKDFYWDSMGPQIAAYKSLTDATHCGILRLDKESGMPFYRDRTKYYERDLKIFKHMVGIYMLRHPKIAKGCFNG